MGDAGPGRDPAAALPFAEIYPPETVAEIERRGRPRAMTRAGAVPRRAAAGGLVAGLLLGLRSVLPTRRERAAVVEVVPRSIAGGEGVTLDLVPGAPAASRGWVHVPCTSRTGPASVPLGRSGADRPTTVHPVRRSSGRSR